MTKVRIKLQNISKSYYSETAVTQALRKINLTFCTGEFVAITGESGSGKSTLLNIIGGMDSFDDGEMFVDGEPTFPYDEEDWETYRRTKIGYVFQDYSLVGHYTALDNIVSALLIMGKEPDSAKETAMNYLKQVGLDGCETHRASELSSGQKQRLSIARALAKNTGIIVADEPTGNLDSETGNQIIRLLKELSKDRLVIMVTHNYDQAEAYVTRKIRLHDGQIVSDVTVEQTDTAKTPPSDQNMTEEIPSDDLPAKKPPSTEEIKKQNSLCHQNRVALLFARRNQKTQKGRAILFTAFLFVVSAVSFLFIGLLRLHSDDYSTRTYSQAAFCREDPTRIVVKRTDGGGLTKNDITQLSSISHVKTVDSCDYANDINFYLEQEEDYTYLYGQQRSLEDGEIKTVSFLNENRYMMSADCIEESDLAAGHLPETRNEIVIYSEDQTVLNTSKVCYFAAHNIWDPQDYYKTDVKIVGILKEETDQVYFSTELCRMLSMHLDSGVYRLLYNYDKAYGDYRNKPEMIPVINDSLDDNEIRLSSKMPEDERPKDRVPFSWQPYDETGQPVGEGMGGIVEIQSSVHESTASFIEVSQKFFDTYYHHNSPQASVYITSYAKLDTVLNSLQKLGFEGVSTYRISMTDYVEELVSERLLIIGISVFGLIAILVAEILILRSLMKIRIKDFFVLKFMGMKMQVIRKISHFEMGGYTLAAILLTIALAWILRFAGIPMICEIMWYYGIGTYLLFTVYNFLLITLTAASFNHLLKGRLNA